MDEHHQPFEQLKQISDNGSEFWSARDLLPLLGYKEWRNFQKVLSKAVVACETSGHQAADHFVDTNKMVELGSGAIREIEDIYLSRYACYLVVQNGDPTKPVVAVECKAITPSAKTGLFYFRPTPLPPLFPLLRSSQCLCPAFSAPRSPQLSSQSAVH